MTPAQRIALYIIAAVAGLLLALWFWGGLEHAPAAPANPSTPTALPQLPTPTPTPPLLPPGYRLSGVAIGGDTSYAAIEQAAGGTNLYRVNADVPGLGRIIRIDGERVVIRTNGGDFDMWVAPAPTPTFSVTRRLTPRTTPTRAPTRAVEGP